MQEKNNKISPIKKRILQFIEYKGITKANFCELTGISYPNLNSKSLQSELGGSQITQISSVFNEISLDWLITGKGEMLRTQRDGQPECSGSATEIELLKEVIHNKDVIIEEMREKQQLLYEKIDFLKAELARCDGMAAGAAAG